MKSETRLCRERHHGLDHLVKDQAKGTNSRGTKDGVLDISEVFNQKFNGHEKGRHDYPSLELDKCLKGQTDLKSSNRRMCRCPKYKIEVIFF